ncbi:MAG: ABC transporter permease [Acidobacteria bacterium]|nr:ABC transporter permease [Acidobacteriota bacterium]
MLRLLAVSGQIAWKALGRNRLRSGLTTLGVVIGVAAVIAMVALGNGAAASVERTLKTAGTSIVQVSSGNFTKGGESMNIASGLGSATTLTRADAAAIGRLENVVHVAAGLRSRTFITASPEARIFTLVNGTEDSLAEIHGWTWLEGKGFTAADVEAGAAKAVLGRIASARLFGDGVDPTGKVVKIHDRDFVVVGMMRAVDADQDEAAFVPVTTLGALTSRASWLQTITVGVTEAGVATSVADAITALLRERHADHIAAAVARASGALGGSQMPGGGNSRMGPADDFVVKTLAAAQVTKGLYTEVAAFALANMPKLDSATMEEMSGTLNRAGTTMTALLASIAAISLVVGGIGIMNIMLVSVTERTREIGLRLAMGARRRDVLVQFLVEAVALSLIGGLVGIAAGIGAARGLTALMSWPTEVSAQAIGLAFAISALIGVAFGFYPARRASRLDPIVALRRE